MYFKGFAGAARLRQESSEGMTSDVSRKLDRRGSRVRLSFCYTDQGAVSVCIYMTCQVYEGRRCRDGEDVVGVNTHDRVLQLQLLLLAVRGGLVLFRPLGTPDRVSLFAELIL